MTIHDKLAPHDNFVPIKQIIKRDITDKFMHLYQIQAETDASTANLVYIGKYDHIPMVPIYECKYDIYDCALVSFLLTKSEMESNEKYEMIGFLIGKGKDNDVVALLTFVFTPTTKISNFIEKQNVNSVSGKFEIILSNKKNDKMVTKTIKSFDKYPGREESIYIITNTLLEENVI